MSLSWLQLYAMGWFINELQFQAHKVDLDDYVVNGEWEIVSIGLTAVESYDLAGFKVLVMMVPTLLYIT